MPVATGEPYKWAGIEVGRVYPCRDGELDAFKRQLILNGCVREGIKGSVEIRRGRYANGDYCIAVYQDNRVDVNNDRHLELPELLETWSI